MGIIGKIIGGTIGFALGGPLGAVAGAVFGHAFDAESGPTMGDEYQRLSALEETQLAFFVSTFSMLAKLARADGEVTPEEMDAVEAFAVRDIGLSAENKAVALNIFRAALASPAAFEDFATQFDQSFHHQPQMVELMIDILLRVSIADGRLNSAEETLILSAVRIFAMSAARYEQIKARYVEKSGAAYQILGCTPRDTNDQIKKKYRQLAQAYHPDKIAAKGLPDEFMQLASDKFREIQAAYETIKKERGFS